MFSKDFSDGLQNWTFYGSPEPTVTAAKGRDHVFDSQGDANHHSGAVYNEPVDLSAGGTIKAEMYIEGGDFSGCWGNINISLEDDPSSPSDETSPDFHLGGGKMTGDNCWAEPDSHHGHTFVKLGDGFQDGKIQHDALEGGWHDFSVEIQEDGHYEVFVDGQSFGVSGEAIGSELLEEAHIVAHGRSSGEDGARAYMDNLEVQTGNGEGNSETWSIQPVDADKAEGDTGSKDFTFTVTRSGDVDHSSALDWSVSGSGPNPADADDFWVQSSPDNQTTNAGTTIPSTGQELAVSLTAPDAASADSISVSGRIDRGTSSGAEERVNVAYVVDTSGSMGNQSSDLQVGDLNGNGVDNTLLDGTIAGFENLNQSLVQDGFQDAHIGVIPFTFSSSVQETAAAGADSNGDGRTDVSEALRELDAGGGHELRGGPAAGE